MNMLEKKRDRKLTDLYQILTRSDFKGRIETNRIIRSLYAIYCLDAVNRQKMPLNEEDYLLLARELLRIEETPLFDYDRSLMTWAKGLLNYMKDENLSIRDIQKKNSIDLKKEIYACIGN